MVPRSCVDKSVFPEPGDAAKSDKKGRVLGEFSGTKLEACDP